MTALKAVNDKKISALKTQIAAEEDGGEQVETDTLDPVPS